MAVPGKGNGSGNQAGAMQVEQIIRSMGDGLITTDLASRVTHVNPAAEVLTGWKNAEARDRPLDEVFAIFHETTRQLVESPVERALHENGIVRLPVRTMLRRKDGSEILVEDSAAPIRDEQGQNIGVVIVFRDGTPHKLTEEHLKEMGRRKDDFLAMLAHELRNPLAPIRTALDLLQMPQADAGTAAWAIGVMDSQVRNLKKLVDDLLDVSRVMRGNIELRREPVDVADMVRSIIETKRTSDGADQLTLTVETPAAAVWIEADRVRAEQIVVNLLNNACKFTPEGGSVKVTVETDGHDAIIRVSDTGVGMSPDVIHDIFGLFVQGDHSLDRADGGLGVGLALARSLAQMHGGDIMASSPGLGLGSEFVLRLPLSDKRATTAPASSSFEPIPMSPLRILVVDDNRGAATLLARLLARFWNHEVTTAYDGLMAEQTAESFRPDVIFLDIGLPTASGYEVAQRLRAREQFAETLIIALSGYGSEEDRQRALVAGFDDYLVKPAGVADLQVVLARYAGRRPKQ
jgi:PAS domain S-box-containing protein